MRGLALVLMVIAALLATQDSAAAQGVGTQCTSNNECSAGLRCVTNKLIPTTQCTLIFLCDTFNLVQSVCRQTCTTNAQCPAGQRCRCPLNRPANTCQASKRACF